MKFCKYAGGLSIAAQLKDPSQKFLLHWENVKICREVFEVIGAP